jgi:ATP-binding cassette subfamily F protein 3
MGREGADAGAAVFGAGVQTAYYEQNMRSMDAEKTVLQEVWDAYPRMAHTAIRNALAAFLFRGDSVEKRISMLSAANAHACNY